MLDRLNCAAPEFDYAGNRIRLVGGKLTFGHGPGYCPERIDNISRRLDCRQIEHDRAPVADRDKPLDAKDMPFWKRPV